MRMLFDHLVGAREDRWRDRQPERLGGLEVDHQLWTGIHLPTDGSTGYVRLRVVYPYEADADKAVRFLARPGDVPVHRLKAWLNAPISE